MFFIENIRIIVKAIKRKACKLFILISIDIISISNTVCIPKREWLLNELDFLYTKEDEIDILSLISQVPFGKAVVEDIGNYLIH